MTFAKQMVQLTALAFATAAMLVLLSGCSSPSAAGDSTSVTRIEVTTTTAAGQPTALAGHRGDHIPDPLINGGYSYQGYGRFELLAGAAGSQTAPGGGGGGTSFFWHDGRFVWAPGRLMEVDEDLIRLMEQKGLPFPDRQPTLADSPTSYVSVGDFSGLPTEQALALFVRDLGGLGWWVRHTYIDSLEPLAVTFALDGADNDAFAEDVLLRAVLQARTRGLVIDSARVEYAGHPGTEPQDLSPGTDLEETAAKLWPESPAAPDNDTVRAMVEGALPAEKAYPGWTLRLLEVSSTFVESRRVTVWVQAAAATREEAEAYVNEVLTTVRSLNAEQQAGIAVVVIGVTDPEGGSIAGARSDLDLGRDSFCVSLP
ncbi:MAG: hypothetical protein GXX83_05270 [Gaiellales bacterium]|nr:hypothetical protein [Gaiellales bacterium]